ncbi:HIT family protein [Kitasatospora sp. NPDC057015]|uniref:HIT family protein n=1 Tax=Kitasatospora sp. NPDC057015 TaxID=3346001 RepID=UPI0036352FE9
MSDRPGDPSPRPAVAGTGARAGEGAEAAARAEAGTGAEAGAGPETGAGDGAGARAAFDAAAYKERARSGPCFVCAMLAGEPGFEHRIVYDDGTHVAFLDRYPTLLGKLLVAPRAHIVDAVRGFDEDAYLALQLVVHRVATALARVVPTERLYVLSLGSMQGYAHVHWHVAALPPGVPYEQQEYHALMTSRQGVLAVGEQEAEEIARALRRELSGPGGD